MKCFNKWQPAGKSNHLHDEQNHFTNFFNPKHTLLHISTQQGLCYNYNFLNVKASAFKPLMLWSEVRIGLTYGRTYHPNTQKYIILRYVTRCSQIITPSYYLETAQILPTGSARIIVTQVCGTALPFPVTEHLKFLLLPVCACTQRTSQNLNAVFLTGADSCHYTSSLISSKCITFP